MTTIILSLAASAVLVAPQAGTRKISLNPHVKLAASDAIDKGLRYLIGSQQPDGGWFAF